jgi:hypothetical protein
MNKNTIIKTTVLGSLLLMNKILTPHKGKLTIVIYEHDNNIYVENKTGPGWGDYIMAIYLCYKYKYKSNNKIYLVYHSKSGRQIFLDFLDKFKNIFEIIYINDVPKTDRVIKTVKDFTYNIFYPNFRSNILSSVKDIFYSSTNKFNLKPNTVVINIGCNTYKLVSLTDVTFQNLICDMIILKKEISFCLIGQSHQICSERLLNLNYDNVLNLIDRDEGLFDLMNIFYNAKLLLSRDTGAIHLAGLSNCNVICLKPQFSVFKPKSKVIYKLKTILHKNPITQNSGHFIEPDHLFYIRRYMPLSDNICEISEYIRYDDNYNNNLMILIIKNILLFLNENKF